MTTSVDKLAHVIVLATTQPPNQTEAYNLLADQGGRKAYMGDICVWAGAFAA